MSEIDLDVIGHGEQLIAEIERLRARVGVEMREARGESAVQRRIERAVDPLREEIERLAKALEALVRLHDSAHQSDGLIQRRINAMPDDPGRCRELASLKALIAARAALKQTVGKCSEVPTVRSRSDNLV